MGSCFDWQVHWIFSHEEWTCSPLWTLVLGAMEGVRP
jgi:hypothetical protein